MLQYAFILAGVLLSASAALAEEQPQQKAPPPPPQLTIAQKPLVTGCESGNGLCFLTISKEGQFEAKYALSGPSIVEQVTKDSARVPTLGQFDESLSLLLKQKTALEEDYKLLVERYNRLVALHTPNGEVRQYVSAPQPDPAAVEDQRRAAAKAQRQQMLLQWMMMQNANRPQTYNLNVRDCSRFPAMCVN